MVRMRASFSPAGFIWAALFVLLLALRTIGTTGYMPAVDHGRLSIVVCPDADPDAPLALGAGHHHHHGKTDHRHPQCPYAAAASLGALGNHWAPLLAAFLFAAALSLLGPMLASVYQEARRERPPTRGPPLPA